MASNYTLSQLDGLFKEVYADKLENLLPGGIVFYKLVPFVSKDKQQGDSYHQPVMLRRSHGFTYSGDGSAFALNDAVSGQTKDANVSAFEIVLRDRIAYSSISRSATDKAAFADATEVVVLNMRESFAVRLEVALMYGQQGIGTISSEAANVITMTTASWAAGVWSGSEGMKIQAYDALTGGTVQNTANSGVMTINSVNMAARTITVDDATGVAASDILFYHGAYGNEMAGLHHILVNTGTLFGIDASTFSLWSGNTHSAGSANLSFNTVTDAINLAMEKGLAEDAVLLVNHNTWTDLMQDIAALRVTDSSYMAYSVQFGHGELEYHTQTGKVTIKSSVYVKEGFAYLLNVKCFKRIGSQDITFNRPGGSESFFMDLENQAGVELRAYTDQALFCHSPGQQVLINNIVNAA
jgi:hypothetical protein